MPCRKCTVVENEDAPAPNERIPSPGRLHVNTYVKQREMRSGLRMKHHKKYDIDILHNPPLILVTVSHPPSLTSLTTVLSGIPTQPMTGTAPPKSGKTTNDTAAAPPVGTDGIAAPKLGLAPYAAVSWRGTAPAPFGTARTESRPSAADVSRRSTARAVGALVQTAGAAELPQNHSHEQQGPHCVMNGSKENLGKPQNDKLPAGRHGCSYGE
ncbi:hypothetical protein B0H66DRAFT_594007 [Apodospora peruviana]|uniref:Uncharacterized protein n=1 Tax=Apodospora peruviana TaxID=516989 RepID=A0AAE0I0P4_9PEZI|nr:hypothetical protein B0H66DRAFT_594007 [Apodospora peruviana]